MSAEADSGAKSELEAMSIIVQTLENLPNDARERVLRWSWEKYSSHGMPSPPRTRKHAKKKTSQKKRGRKSTASLIKNLNLKPKGKKAFDEFSREKAPSTFQEKCVVSVYYLHHELEVPEISVGHVLTCFKDANWRIPADLSNTLQLTASRQGWLDTSNMDSIQVTMIGENLVEHDLPREEDSGL